MKTTHTKCKCTTCGDYFNSVAAFDKHRTGEHGVSRRCMTHQERREKKMDTNVAGYWVTALQEPAGAHWAVAQKQEQTA